MKVTCVQSKPETQGAVVFDRSKSVLLIWFDNTTIHARLTPDQREALAAAMSPTKSEEHNELVSCATSFHHCKTETNHDK